jgi:hydrogenase-4 component B
MAGGLAALACCQRSSLATALGAGSAVIGGSIGAVGAITSLVSAAKPEAADAEWNAMLGGSLALGADGLSSFFLVLVFSLSALAALYGSEYLRSYRGSKNLGLSWFFYSVLVVSMALVCLARNGLLFLVAWEAMALSSYFLVLFENERPGVIHAGWTYLVASHLGTALLLVLFVMMAGPDGSLDFSNFAAFASHGGPVLSIAFVLAVIGFGTKAGFMPVHVWLPEAHPAAPSHVSALMSGIMIKMGIYGIVRTVTFLGTPEPWWGWTLVGIGAVSGVLGVLFAIAQHDLKRLLAYHSVENIGIIALGLGIGLVGWSAGSPAVAALGLAGGLLHVANHAVFKSLLFFGAGAVKHATHTLEIDSLGGLGRRMPWTALTFLVASAAISGLPPLNGFVSEFLVYLASYRSMTEQPLIVGAAGIVVIAALALIGGLAAACFAKAFGIIFLGEPRSEHGREAREVGPAMRLPMIVLAVACILGGLSGPYLLSAMAPIIAPMTGLPADAMAAGLAQGTQSLWYIVAAAGGFFVLVAGLALVRRLLLAGRTVEEVGTWDCGYSAPTARMQYTASSFAQPIVRMFRTVLRPKRHFKPPVGLLPGASDFETKTPDMFSENVWRPAFAYTSSVLSRLRQLQHGHVQLYVLYLVLALLALLLWRLR